MPSRHDSSFRRIRPAGHDALRNNPTFRDFLKSMPGVPTPIATLDAKAREALAEQLCGSFNHELPCSSPPFSMRPTLAQFTSIDVRFRG
jgi:hypothetical protein